MNSTILYLIRHGTTIYNKKGIFQGSMDVPLGKQGLFQADCLAERMKNIPMDAVYSSPLKRAYKTAQKLADAHGGLPIYINEDLSELNCGLMEGNTSRKNAELFPEAVAEMHEHPESFRAPEGESTTELQERSVHAFRRIIADNPGRTVAVVSHGFVIWAYLSYIRGLPLKNMGKDVVANASVTCLKYKNADNMPEIIYLNDDSHIPTDNKFNVSQSFCAP